jgi:pseudaminic acid biosynthesis-associated methylase
MVKYLTEQETFWASSFGDEYIERNKSQKLLASNLNFFTKALSRAGQVKSVIEFGSNVGMNMRALKLLYPHQSQFSVEINPKAAEELKSLLGEENVFNGSILDFESSKKYELSLVKGLLIHINPEMLQAVYQKLYDYSTKYVLICEYYNPNPIEVDYRGHSGKLYKRDFCGEMMVKFLDLKLIDYGFAYKKDPAFPQDDITWFLMEKSSK